MHSIDFLQDLAVVMIVAGLVTIVFHRLKQPVVLGYIIAGVIIGPHTPPYALIHDEANINTLSELGVILLMFSLGLEFSLRKLTRVGVPALIAALLEILVLFWVGYEIGHFFDWPLLDSIFLGAMLSMSSTTVIIKVLSELGKMKERFAQLIFGILIIEDILGIAMIALLSGIAMTGSLRVGEVGMTLGKLGIFMAVTLVAGLLGVPRLISYVARFKSNEMLIVTVLGLCFGVSLLSAKLGYSVALGAFVIGAVIAEAREIHRIEALIEPVRDMFSAIFFVAIGLLIDPKLLVTYWQPVVVITLAVVVGKVLTCSFGSFVGGNDTRTSLRVGMGLAQIGEFSFIIASLGVTLKVTSAFLYPIAVAVSAVTTLLTPYLIKSADGAVEWWARVAPQPLVNSLDLYTRWVGELGVQRQGRMAVRLALRWSAQMVLNAALVAGVFIGAAFVERHPPGWLQELGLRAEGLKATLWLAAMVVSLPLLIATFRKLQALGLLVAETKVSRAAAGERTEATRAIVAQVVPIAGVIGLGVFVFMLSSTLLPSRNVMILLLLIVAATTWWHWRAFVKIYSRAQIALEETFAQPPAPRPQGPPAALQSLFREADVETVILAAGSPAIGQLIRELELRTRTGASIVGIERSGVNIINPSADEELQAGDRVLLLGNRTQLDAARKCF
ncbi:MAG TPA: cation:proton antiporter [Verrucomicrobiota bacterium]|nr:cation:proton antiporter [Verrucomicrobiota bacterium]HQL79991.1 cation:proton antiporter [Verrucomicrobiota bacterium]